MSKSRSGAPRRVAAGLLAGALTVVGFALAPPAGAVDDVAADRLAGINRYGTAAAIAGQDDFDGATTAILATGETFPDALAASGLAGSIGPAPIILTQSDTYSDEAQEALTNLTGITDVIIVGGTAAISQGVEDAIEADGFAVSRVAGTDRYATAAAIAGDLGDIGEIDGLTTALIATGTGFADALAGGPTSYASVLPILLVTPEEIPAATAAAIADLGIEQAVILGGTAAVSDDVEAELDALTGNPSVRVAGVNRFGTAAAAGEFAIAELGWAPTEVLLANGLNFPDALAGGPLGGERSAPIILTASLPTESADFLNDHSDTITNITALGGTGVIDAETLADAEAAAEDTADDVPDGNATATTRPELVSASIVETRIAAAGTATRPPGTYVLYCFDEAITGAAIDNTQFFLYNGDGTRSTAPAGAQTPVAGQTYTSGVSPTDNKCAEVFYPALATAAAAANLTLATVNNGAVTGAAGAGTDTNIEGDAPLTPASSASAAAGATAAPDLVSVGNFRAGSTGDVTAVDFTFDVAAFTTNGQTFGLVSITGTSYACQGPAAGSTTPASGLAAPGGNGTTVLTVNCIEPGGPEPGVPSAQHTAENVARGTIGAGSVATANAGAVVNPLQAADVGNGGNSDAPDLALVVFAPDSVANRDVVGYIFDEDVRAGTLDVDPTAGESFVYTTSTSFGIYDSNGNQRNNTFSAVLQPGVGTEVCSRSGESNATVLCFFADNTLAGATYVGGNVRAGAVTEVPAANLANGADEVGVAPSAGPSAQTTGRTDGPDLLSVVINTVVSPFGNTSYSATFTFDEDTADTADAASTVSGAGAGGNDSTGENVITQLLHLYLSDGIRLDCNSLGLPDSTTVLTARTEDNDATVTCGSFIVGTGGVAATQAQIRAAVVGAVDYGAADDEAVGGDTSPEGAAVTTGGNGTPA